MAMADMVPMLVWIAASVAVVVALACCAYRSFFNDNRHFVTLPAAEAAEALFNHWRSKQNVFGQSPPEKLRGVFWMSDNAAPELCILVQSGRFDPESRRLTIYTFGEYNWTLSNNVPGCIEYYTLGWLLGISISFIWDEDYTYAPMSIYLFGCIKLPSFIMDFHIKQLDDVGHVWARRISCFGRESEYGSYKLRKVIDENGNRLPAFAAMEEQVHSNLQVKGTTTKTPKQVVPRQSLFPCQSGAQEISESESEESRSMASEP
eukprot:TRINITY_DN55413_c0_g1_i1.p1 TRINITY_DN55413_c0_g1~~TRINITY_DN55413_c0_g1_i1.p1  ORF type:complete len:273 (+),score=54.35 TRINITY_DN55413_c0_g1_i1:36-821(+)